MLSPVLHCLQVGQLSRSLYERLMQLWMAADMLPTLVFVGDFWQLQGVEPSKARDSPLWSNPVHMVRRELHTMQRCKCDELKKKLQILRIGKPSKQQLGMILRNHKAPSTYLRSAVRMQPTPTSWDIQQILRETPNTVFLTISRRAASMLNGFAVENIFADQQPLITLPTDPESNLANYWKSQLVAEEPLMQPIYAGMKVVLTKNPKKWMKRLLIVTSSKQRVTDTTTNTSHSVPRLTMHTPRSMR